MAGCSGPMHKIGGTYSLMPPAITAAHTDGHVVRCIRFWGAEWHDIHRRENIYYVHAINIENSRNKCKIVGRVTLKCPPDSGCIHTHTHDTHTRSLGGRLTTSQSPFLAIRTFCSCDVKRFGLSHLTRVLSAGTLILFQR